MSSPPIPTPSNGSLNLSHGTLALVISTVAVFMIVISVAFHARDAHGHQRIWHFTRGIWIQSSDPCRHCHTSEQDKPHMWAIQVTTAVPAETCWERITVRDRLRFVVQSAR